MCHADVYVSAEHHHVPSLTLSEQTQRRLLEILPGFLVWSTFIASIVLSFVRPLWVIYFVILFDLYWVFRVVYSVPYLLASWWRYRRDVRVDWHARAATTPGIDRIRQLIFLPTYTEDVSVIRATLEQILCSTFPADRLMIVLAGEERDRERFERNALVLASEYDGKFLGFSATLHPKDLPNEIPGKGSNLQWSAREVVPHVLARGFSPDDVIVSSFDVDTIIHPNYFSCLATTYLTTPNPTRSSYQPIPLYNNNLWESPAAVRVAMFGTTFWLMTELARPERMMTFSSHSMSLRLLMDVGYWQKDIVSEDSRIFLQGLVHYNGDYRVTPIYLPVSMDTVMSGKYWHALGALYCQIRRWAWGVENFPYLAEQFRTHREIPLATKIAYLWKQLEGMYTWATAPILIFILGRLPFFVAPQHVREAAIFQNTPFTLEWLMRIAMIGVFVSAGVSLTLLPPRPAHVSRGKTLIVAVLQWLLLPVTFVVFGAIPAIDAQTRLMFGMPLRFTVSPKRKTVV